MKATHSKFGFTMAGMACLFAAGCGGGSESSKTRTGGIPAYSAVKAGAPATTAPVNTAGTPAAGGTTIPAATTSAAGTTASGGSLAPGGTTGAAGMPAGGATTTATASTLGGTTGSASTFTTSSPDAGVPDAPVARLDSAPDSAAVDSAVDAAPRTDLTTVETGTTGACGASTWNKTFDVSSISGAVVDQSGNLFFATKFFDTLDFGAGPLTSAGSADIALVKMDATGKTLWAKAYGDTSDQIPGRIALTKSGLVAMSGTFSGTLTLKNTATNTGVEAIDFLGAVDGAGAGLWVKGYDTKGGAIVAVASNGADDTFAVCGYALDAATDLVPGATAGGDGLEDILLAKINATTGAMVWSRQIGGAGSQICSALAVDAAGDVIAAGQYNGTLDLGKGALSLVPVQAARALWVGKFDGATGAAKASNGWGNDSKQVLKALALDGAGNPAIVGALRGVMTVGSRSLASVGSSLGADAGSAAKSTTDAFVIKLDSNLIPLWVRSWGDATGLNQEARTVTFVSDGDVLVAGNMKGTLDPGDGLATLVGATGADFYKQPQTDPFWIRLRGTTGTALCAQRYGDQYGQSADLVVTNPGPASTSAILIGNFQGSIDFGLGAAIAPGIGSSMPKSNSFVLQLLP